MELTQELVQELFTLDEQTGILYRKGHTGLRAGDINPTHNRWRVRVGKERIYRAKINFLYVHGYLPAIVDHIDRNQLNDRPDNLRAATSQQSRWNMGCRGCSFEQARNRWRATIGARIDGKLRSKHLGYFKTEAEARAAYESIAKKRYGQFFPALP
jgi:hypothetical protein